MQVTRLCSWIAILKSDWAAWPRSHLAGSFFVGSPHQRRLGIKDSPEQALADWSSFAEWGEEDELPRKWAEEFTSRCTEVVYEWLNAKGVKFFPIVHWVERGLLVQGNSVPRFHMVWGTGHGLIVNLCKHIYNHPNKANLTLKFRHKVDGFNGNVDGVTGVKGVNEETGERFEYDAKTVVVATGGICGDVERVKKEWYKDWGNAPAIILNGSHQYADGAVHDIVSNQLRANITHLDWQWNYAAGVHHPNPHPDRPHHGLSIVPPKSALWVDASGQRFGPMPLVSAFDTRYLVEQISKSEKQYSWQILNKRIAIKELAISGSQYNQAIREKKLLKFLMTVLRGNKQMVDHLIKDCKDFVVANSIEELAQKMNALTGDQSVDVSRLKTSIRSYDALIDKGAFNDDEQLRRITQLRQYRGDKARTLKYAKIEDSKGLPLIAIREFILSRKSLGGIQTDLDCRVLAQPVGGQQTVIPGLYAVGEAAGFGGGGMHGKRALEGTFLGGCIFTGRLAAKHIRSGA